MPAIEGFVERYREAVGRRFERLPVHLWPGQATEPQRLQRLFVPVEVDRVPTGLPSSRADLADGVRERATPAGLRDLVARHGALLLVGDAGSGKTTTLRQMALTAAEEGWGALPVYLRLAEYEAWSREDEGRGLDEYVTVAMADLLGGDRHIRDVEDALPSLELLLLLDGLDEIPRRERRERVEADLVELLEGRGVRTAAVMTTRPPPPLLPAVSAHELWLRSWSADSVELFLERWYSALGAEPPQDLLTLVREDPDLVELAGRPLLAAMLATLSHTGRLRLPAGRAVLYEQCLDLLLERWRREQMREVGEDPGPPLFAGGTEARRLLGTVALRLLERGGGDSMARGEFVEAARTFYEAAGFSPFEALQRAGWVADRIRPESGIMLGPEGGDLHFLHRSFTEYLAAVCLCNRSDHDLEAWLVRHTARPVWRGVVLLVLGRIALVQGNAGKANRLLRALRELPGTLRAAQRWRSLLVTLQAVRHGVPLDDEASRWLESERKELMRDAPFAAALMELARLEGVEALPDEEALDRLLVDTVDLKAELQRHRGTVSVQCEDCEAMDARYPDARRPPGGWFSRTALQDPDVAALVEETALDSSEALDLRNRAFTAAWLRAPHTTVTRGAAAARRAVASLGRARSLVGGPDLDPPLLQDIHQGDVLRADQLLEAEDFALVVGGPGQGKTSILRSLAVALLPRPTEPLPVLLPYVAADADPAGVARSVRDAVGMRRSGDVLPEVRAGIAVLVDDLDLCADPARAALGLRSVGETLGVRVWVVMTSRSALAGDLLDDVPCYRLVPPTQSDERPAPSQLLQDLAGVLGRGSRAELVQRLAGETGPLGARWRRLSELAGDAVLERADEPALRAPETVARDEPAAQGDVFVRDWAGRPWWRSRTLLEVLAGARVAECFDRDPGSLVASLRGAWLDPDLARHSVLVPAAASLVEEPAAFVEAVLALPEGLAYESTLLAARCAVWLEGALDASTRRRVLSRTGRLLAAGVMALAEELDEVADELGLPAAVVERTRPCPFRGVHVPVSHRTTDQVLASGGAGWAGAALAEARRRREDTEACEHILARLTAAGSRFSAASAAFAALCSEGAVPALVGGEGEAAGLLRHLRTRPEMVLPEVLGAWGPGHVDLLSSCVPRELREDGPGKRCLHMRVVASDGVSDNLELEARCRGLALAKGETWDIPALSLPLDRRSLSAMATLLWPGKARSDGSSGWRSLRHDVDALTPLLSDWPDTPAAQARLDDAWRKALLGHYLLSCSRDGTTSLLSALVSALGLIREFGCTRDEAARLAVHAWYVVSLSDAFAGYVYDDLRESVCSGELAGQPAEVARFAGTPEAEIPAVWRLHCRLLLAHVAERHFPSRSPLGPPFEALVRPVFADDAAPAVLAVAPLRFLLLLCRELGSEATRLEGFGLRLDDNGDDGCRDVLSVVPNALTLRFVPRTAEQKEHQEETRRRLIFGLAGGYFREIRIAVGESDAGVVLPIGQDEEGGGSETALPPHAGIRELHEAGHHREAFERLVRLAKETDPDVVDGTLRTVHRWYLEGAVPLRPADRQAGLALWRRMAEFLGPGKLGTAVERLLAHPPGGRMEGTHAAEFLAAVLPELDEGGRRVVVDALCAGESLGAFSAMLVQRPLYQERPRLSADELDSARRAMEAVAACRDVVYKDRLLARLFLDASDTGDER